MIPTPITPKLGVCYYPEHWPENKWGQDAAQMREMGLTWVRIGEFAWSRLEPKANEFNWGWLDRAIETLGDVGLKIILGTPTATPPRWIVDKYPDMLAVDKQGRSRKFGARRHYCFSHEGYLSEAKRITQKLAERYGGNPHIQAWQTDNEYGCHDTVISYSDVAKSAFQKWLEDKYKNCAALNKAWGNVFWSMEYEAFSQIDLPNLTVTEPNPAHVMDFRRFSSDQVAVFNKAQCDILREFTDKPLIHNYMGRITDFDHFDVGADLDIASWDSYPLGFLEDRSDYGEHFKHDYSRQGDPDFQAFHHDLYRAVGKGRWWVMEQQPGPVNWAPYNPAPLPGMVRLWTWEAIAHGAEVVSYFRWRQAPFGQEQMHAGLQRPDGQTAQGGREAVEIAAELAKLTALKSGPAKIAIVFDYASSWAWEIQPQGLDFNYFRLVYDLYRALRRLGQSVDIIPAVTSGFGERDLILIPGLFNWTDELRRAVRAYKGHLIIGPRTGSKTANFQIPTTLAPNCETMDIKVSAAETLRPCETIPLKGQGHFHIWREFIETSEEISLKTEDGEAAMISAGTHHYLCGWPDDIAAQSILASILEKASLPVTLMPDGVRQRDIGPYRLYTNYNKTNTSIGAIDLAAADVCLIEKSTDKIIITS